MYWYPAAQETTTAKSPAFFRRFQTEKRVLRFKALKLFRMLVILWGVFATFWDMARFINQSLFFPFQAQPDYTCWKGFSLKFRSEFCIRGNFSFFSNIFCSYYDVLLVTCN